jgi:serine/threonine protein kinase
MTSPRISLSMKKVRSSEELIAYTTRDKTVKPKSDVNALRQHIVDYFSRYNTIPRTTHEYYTMLKVIGKGAFGKVYLASHKFTKMDVAIKTIDKSLLTDSYQRFKVVNEIQILRTIRNAYIIRLLEVYESST